MFIVYLICFILIKNGYAGKNFKNAKKKATNQVFSKSSVMAVTGYVTPVTL